MKSKSTTIGTIIAVIVVIAAIGVIIWVSNDDSDSPPEQAWQETGVSKTESTDADSTKTNSNTKTSDESSESKGNDTISTEDGVIIKEVAVTIVGSTPNFQVVFDNSDNNTDVEFDCSKFSLEFADGTSIQPTRSTKTLTAGESYIQWAFPFSDNDLTVGDQVKIYYGDKVIATVQVED